MTKFNDIDCELSVSKLSRIKELHLIYYEITMEQIKKNVMLSTKCSGLSTFKIKYDNLIIVGDLYFFCNLKITNKDYHIYRKLTKWIVLIYLILRI